MGRVWTMHFFGLTRPEEVSLSCVCFLVLFPVGEIENRSFGTKSRPKLDQPSRNSRTKFSLQITQSKFHPNWIQTKITKFPNQISIQIEFLSVSSRNWNWIDMEIASFVTKFQLKLNFQTPIYKTCRIRWRWKSPNFITKFQWQTLKL